MTTPLDPPTIRYIDGRRMQCKDIPDGAYLGAMAACTGSPLLGARNRWEVHAELEAAVGPLPENLFLAKSRRLIARGLIDGCACGCRGDFTLAK